MVNMKKLLEIFHKHPSDPSAAANGKELTSTSRPSGSNIPHEKSRGRLNEQLSKKARHPSIIPGSFYEREQKFKATAAPAQHHVVPRAKGFCQIKVGGVLSSRKLAWCILEGHWLYIYLRDQVPSAEAALTEVHGEALKKIDLVGSHLSAPHSGEIMVKEAEGGVVVLYMPEEEKEQWMVGLSKVPGLFRRVSDYYILGKSWGHGATCNVQEAISRFTGRKLAVKSRLHKTREATTAMHNELQILQMCAKNPHPAIPTLEDYFFDEDGTVELVMELMEGGELLDWIAAKKKFTEDEARDVFRQVVDGVRHLHSLGIAHRDLKPENLMYSGVSSSSDAQQIRIVDYDLAKVNYSPEWQGRTPCGSMHFMAPEVVLQEEYSLAIDMWSLGVVLYILLCGRMPFCGETESEVEAAIVGGQYDLTGELWEDVSESAKDLVRKLLDTDPKARPTAQQCLQHPWLKPHIKSNQQNAGLALKSPQRLRELAASSDGLTSLSTRQALRMNMSPVRERSRELSTRRRPPSVRRDRPGSTAATSLDLDKMRLQMDLAAAGGGNKPEETLGGSPVPSYTLLNGGGPQDDAFADLGAYRVEENGYHSDGGIG